MAASVQFRPQNRDLGVLMRDVDEDLAIYLGLPNGENNLEITDDDSFLLSSKTSQYEVVIEMATADSEWPIAEPDLSVLPKVQNKELQVAKSEPANNTSEDSASSPRKPKSPSASDNAASNKRPLSSSSLGNQKPNSRPSTPTVRRQALTLKSKPSTPSSRSTLPSSKPKPDQTTISKTSSSSRSSNTPTPKSSIHSDKSALSSSARSSGQKVVSGTKCKNPVSSSSSSSGAGTSQTVKSKSRDILPLSQCNSIQDLEGSIPNKRPVSATRGRSSTANPSSNNNGKLLRRQSCSPAKTHALGGYKSGSVKLSRTPAGHDNDDDVNPVLMGTKMVERVVNMRKLAPPKQDHHAVSHNQDKPKRSAKDSSSGFGRSLSSKSLDMAIRHMDIRRSIPDDFGPAVATSGAKSRTTTATICDVTDVTETSSSSSSSSSSSGNGSSRTVWIVAESSIFGHLNN